PLGVTERRMDELVQRLGGRGPAVSATEPSAGAISSDIPPGLSSYIDKEAAFYSTQAQIAKETGGPYDIGQNPKWKGKRLTAEQRADRYAKAKEAEDKATVSVQLPDKSIKQVPLAQVQ